MNIADYLTKNQVIFIDEKSRNQTLRALARLAESEKLIDEWNAFYDKVLEREEIVSTGIGMGVAIPHAKSSDYQDFFICLGILSKGVEWDALDGREVRIVFLIGGPDDRQTEYLQILSALTQAIKDEKIRKKILTLKSQEAIIELFRGK